MDVKLFLKNLYVLPYIGGILVVVSIFFPAATNFMSRRDINSFAFWIWGLVAEIDWYQIGEGWMWLNEFYIISDLLILILGIIISIIVAYLGVKIVIRARLIGKNDKYLDSHFVKLAVIPLILITIWVIVVQIYYSITGHFLRYFLQVEEQFPLLDLDFLNLPNFSFWNYFTMNFGTIGIYIGASLPIIGYLIHIIEYKRFDYLFFEDETDIKN
jgi:hypothetical protein